MRRLHKMLWVATFAVLAAAAAPRQATAAPIVYIDPAYQEVANGSPVSANIVVSGLVDEVLTGFSVLLDFNPSVLAFVDYTIGGSLLPGSVNAFDGTDTSNAGTGTIDFFFTSGDTYADLDAAQTPPSFILATINFTGSLGRSALNLSLAGQGATPLTQIASDEGVSDLGAELQDGEVCVSRSGTEGCPTVPEPGLLSLLGAGLAAAVVRRRAAAKQ